MITSLDEARSLLRTGEILCVKTDRWERLWRYSNGQFMSKTFTLTTEQPDWSVYSPQDIDKNLLPDIRTNNMQLYNDLP